MRIDAASREQVVRLAREAGGEECCGVLIGRDEPREVLVVRPMANVAPEAERPRRFRLDPREMLAAEREADAAGLRVIGIYHSHPNGVCKPSETDRAEAWPWYSYVIVAPDGAAWDIGSWRLVDDQMVREDLDA